MSRQGKYTLVIMGRSSTTSILSSQTSYRVAFREKGGSGQAGETVFQYHEQTVIYHALYITESNTRCLIIVKYKMKC